MKTLHHMGVTMEIFAVTKTNPPRVDFWRHEQGKRMLLGSFYFAPEIVRQCGSVESLARFVAAALAGIKWRNNLYARQATLTEIDEQERLPW